MGWRPSLLGGGHRSWVGFTSSSRPSLLGLEAIASGVEAIALGLVSPPPPNPSGLEAIATRVEAIALGLVSPPPPNPSRDLEEEVETNLESDGSLP